MNIINISALNKRLPQLKEEFNAKKLFKYVVFDNFFDEQTADKILHSYPKIEDGKWDGTTYIDQKNKFQKTEFEKEPILNELFRELNSKDFLQWLQTLTEIEDELVGDEKLFGGGLHQSISGAFLNVHVDYNYHPETKYHRRLNVLIYMNKDWKGEYEGHLELWDMTKGKKRIEKISPDFNRCVIFETNEISYHGHPHPLNTPKGINRKSIATYYYTKDRPKKEVSGEHNTVYVNTSGISGQMKRLKAAFKAARERLKG